MFMAPGYDDARPAIFGLFPCRALCGGHFSHFAPCSHPALQPRTSPMAARRTRKNYKAISNKLGFPTPGQIFFDHARRCRGLFRLSRHHRRRHAEHFLRGVDGSAAAAGALHRRLSTACEIARAVLSALGTTTINPGDILVTRFFAPKIMNINLPEATRPTGWRKLVRLKARRDRPHKPTNRLRRHPFQFFQRARRQAIRAR